MGPLTDLAGCGDRRVEHFLRHVHFDILIAVNGNRRLHGSRVGRVRIRAGSAVRRRCRGRRAGPLADLLLANLEAINDDLDAGAIVVIEDERVRIRQLPI